jgi:uncharacterized protein YdhG (YjbR/CyaY superfamily)
MEEVDTYFSKVAQPQLAELARIRSLIRQVVPQATEAMSYGMPGFKYKGKYLIAYAPFHHHLSVFPGSEAIEAAKDILEPFKTSKGTVQFTLEQPLPDEVVKRLVELRRQAIDG